MGTLASKIRELRNQLGLSQEELASHVNVSMHTVFRWEKGARIPDANEIVLLSKALNTSGAYLLGETDDRSSTSESPQRKEGKPRSQALQDLEQMIKDLAHENPDIGGLLRTTVENWEDLGEEDIKFISDSLSIALGRISDDLRSRMRKESKDGRL